jgi:hypothetical protein
MKKIIIITTLIFFSINAKSQCGLPTSDTLQWLKTHIEQKSSYFNGKPLKTLLDSLCGLKNKLKFYYAPIEYFLDDDDSLAVDYIYSKKLTICLGNILDSTIQSNVDTAFHNSFFNKTPYTYSAHIPRLNIIFKTKVPFPREIIDDRNDGMYWNRRIAYVLKPYLVDSVTIDEY